MKCVKAPVVIEAETVYYSNGEVQCNPNAPEWLMEALRKTPGEVGALWYDKVKGCLVVGSMEGLHFKSPNAMLMRGVKGELYWCEGDIFRNTYIRVETTFQKIILKVVTWLFKLL